MSPPFPFGAEGTTPFWLHAVAASFGIPRDRGGWLIAAPRARAERALTEVSTLRGKRIFFFPDSQLEIRSPASSPVNAA